MTASTPPLNARPTWKALEAHHRASSDVHLRELFAADPGAASASPPRRAGLYLDYSKHRITDETLRLLRRARRRSPACAERIDAMFRGEKINATENARRAARRAPRAARRVDPGRRQERRPRGARRARPHGGLRRSRPQRERGPGTPASASATSSTSASAARTSGPVMAYEALRAYGDRTMTFRFVSNVDGTDFVEATRDLDPAETLFIVSSKTFTTLETMTNARTARAWMPGSARRRARGRQALRGGLDQRRRGREVRHRHRQHVRLLGLGRRALLDGLGDRPVDHDRHRTGPLPRDARRASTPWTSTSARTPFARNLPGADGRCSPSGTPTSSAPRRSPFCPTTST